MLLGSAVVTALATIVAAAIARSVLRRRVRILVETATKLRGGDLSARTGLSHESGGLNRLARALDEMATTLEARERRILDQAAECAKQGRRFRALIENSPDGVVLLDVTGVIRYASPSTTRLLGYTLAGSIGCDAFRRVHPEDLDDVRARFTEVIDTPLGYVSLNFRLRHRNGGWRWIGCVASNLLGEPSVRAIVANYRDITERKNAEEYLRRMNVTLDRSLQERTTELLRINGP
jgi:PAS domain S-box-containing protein